ncbi:MAG: hypothetical protein AAFR61_04995 [Bacteroidota bacterium]
MKQVIGIRREDLNKKGEKRVALDPEMLSRFQHPERTFLVQPAHHPDTGEEKRAFEDEAYEQVGALVQEDLQQAALIFGIKEVSLNHLFPEKAYVMFSHTHKGQIKNRPLLSKLHAQKNTLIDYELMVDAGGQRVVKAFTFFAGYAGMTDSLWVLGERWQQKGISSPFQRIQQSVNMGGLENVRNKLREIGQEIAEHGTPENCPPLICGFLGDGKTSSGAQEMFDLLPSREITLAELPKVFAQGSRKQVYKLVLTVSDMFRIKTGSPYVGQEFSAADFFQLYLKEPDHFESNLDQIFPYCTLLMNCILWSPEFPRLISREQARQWYAESQTLEVIGDITCDPEGAIQFSQETWIDAPTFIYQAETNESTVGITGEGIAVMAVTNLPCEFPADASRHFGADLSPYIEGMLAANYQAETLSEAGLPAEIEKAVILWKGNFPPAYAYMEAYLTKEP